jgi:hypothetical protein
VRNSAERGLAAESELVVVEGNVPRATRPRRDWLTSSSIFTNDRRRGPQRSQDARRQPAEPALDGLRNVLTGQRVGGRQVLEDAVTDRFVAEVLDLPIEALSPEGWSSP